MIQRIPNYQVATFGGGLSFIIVIKLLITITMITIALLLISYDTSFFPLFKDISRSKGVKNIIPFSTFRMYFQGMVFLSF